MTSSGGPDRRLGKLNVLARFEIHGRVSAERVLLARHFDHLVSFRDVGGTPLRAAAHAADRIEFEFDDASNPASGLFGYRPPQLEDLRLLIEWLRERRDSLRAGSCLFQCEQGISRSTAGACIAFRVLGESREQALARVKKQHPGAHPNVLMLELAQRILGN